MKMMFNITFKSGTRTVTTIEGIKQNDAENLTVGEMVEEIQKTEQFLEKLTGLHVHIELAD